MDWEELYEVVSAEIVAASRNALLEHVPGFTRLKSDTSRFARFDVETLTTVTAVCVSAGEGSALVVSRFPVDVPARFSAEHQPTRASIVMNALVDKALESDGWSAPFPPPLVLPTFLGIGSRVNLDDRSDVATLKCAIDDDDEVLPALDASMVWLQRFAAAPVRPADERGKVRLQQLLREAATAAVTALVADRAALQHDAGLLRLRLRELNEQAGAFRAAGKNGEMRRALETRIAVRPRLAALEANIEAISARVARVKTIFS